MEREDIKHIDRIRVSVDFLNEGTVLPGDAYDAGNRIILRSHVPLSGEVIRDLRKQGVRFIYYSPDNGSSSEAGDEGIEQFRARAHDLMAMIQNSMRNSRRPDMMKAEYFIDDLKKFAFANASSFLNLMKIRDFDDYIYTHPVNVGLLSMILAEKCGADDRTVMETGFGAVFQDIGKLILSRDILDKKEKLHDEEIMILRRHAETGSEFLRRYAGLTGEALDIVDQHHEWYNGRGYPRGLSDMQISTGAKYAAICDVFDAMITERPYKRAFPFREAVIFIIRGMAERFNPGITGFFLREMTPILMDEPVFPAETLVLLNTGEVARVIESHSISDDRPDVLIMTDRKKNRLRSFFDVDLSMDEERRIDRVLRFPQT
jgi:HD-GYP domain-containing protein (c-di-GMP phosphodiesterase class II)